MYKSTLNNSSDENTLEGLGDTESRGCLESYIQEQVLRINEVTPNTLARQKRRMNLIVAQMHYILLTGGTYSLPK
jgi:hypothetical protein